MLHLTMKMKRPFFHSIYLFGLTGFFYEISIAMFLRKIQTSNSLTRYRSAIGHVQFPSIQFTCQLESKWNERLVGRLFSIIHHIAWAKKNNTNSFAFVESQALYNLWYSVSDWKNKMAHESFALGNFGNLGNLGNLANLVSTNWRCTLQQFWFKSIFLCTHSPVGS